MFMTDEQKYNAVLKELGELLQNKNTTISCQKWQIDQLKEKLEAAEKERDADKQQIKMLKEELAFADETIAALKGGAA